jgi:hypothetical protein
MVDRRVPGHAVMPIRYFVCPVEGCQKRLKAVRMPECPVHYVRMEEVELSSIGESVENLRPGIEYNLGNAERLSAKIDDGLGGLNRLIDVASWADAILEAAAGATTVLPNTEYRKGLEDALSELSFVDRGALHTVFGPDGTVNVVGLRNLCDFIGGRFVEDMTSVLGAVAQREQDYLPKAGKLVDRLPPGEGWSYRSELAGLQLLAEQQPERMPQQTRFPRSIEPGEAVEFVATQGDFVLPIRFLDAWLIKDDPTDIKIYLRKPPVELKLIEVK